MDAHQFPSLQEREAAYRQQQAAERRANREEFAANLFGPRYRACTFDSFRFDMKSEYERLQIDVHQATKEYADNLQSMIASGTNLILYGTVGTGKDHLAAAVAKSEPNVKWLIEIGWLRASMRHRTGAELFAEFRSAMAGDKLETVIANDLSNCGILFLSDPAPPGGGTLSEYQRSVLYRIVDQRYRDCLPTVVTVNVSNLDELDQQLSPPIADRLIDGAVILECNWPTYRTPREVLK